MNREPMDDPNDALYKGEAFQAFFKEAPQSVVIKANAPHFTILAVSDDFTRLSLKNRADLLGQDFFDFFPDHSQDPSGRQNAIQALNEVVNSGKKVDLPIYKYDVYSSKSGKMESLYWSNSNQPVFDQSGKVTYIINTTANITAEMVLKEMAASSADHFARQQQRINDMFFKAPIGMALYSKDSYTIEYANEMICKMWNQGGPEEVLGKVVFEMIPELEGQKLKEIFKRVVHSGTAFITKETPITYARNEAEETYYFDLHFEPVYGPGNEIIGMLSLANEVTEQVNTRKSIEEAEERLRLASEATGIATWDLDLQTRKVFYSPRLADLFGYPGKKDMDHRLFRQTIHPEDLGLVEQAFKHALTSGKYRYEARIMRPDQIVYWIRVSGKVLFSEGHIPVRMLGTVMDITENKHEEIQKNDFIAIASHELKTPLTSLKGYAQLLKLGKGSNDPEFISGLAGRIEGQINKMTKLIYSFLDLSRIESKKTELMMEKVNLNELIQEVTNDYLFQDRNHPLSFEPVELPLIYADKQKISQVMENLISNAIKYSPDGGSVQISAALENENILVSVTDHGIGIDNNHQEKIFDRFYRIDDLKVKNASGFGIGLYLCADIVKRHRGKIGLQSEPGKGSNFYFTLPVNY